MRRSRPNAPFKPPRLMTSSNASSSTSKSTANGTSPSSSASADDSGNSLQSSNGHEPNNASEDGMANPSKRMKIAAHRELQPLSMNSPSTSKPTQSHPSSAVTPKQSSLKNNNGNTYYMVQWRKCTTKKNKFWDGDGYIVASSTGIVLKGDSKGNGQYRIMGKTNKPSVEGLMRFGAFEAEVDYQVTSMQELSSLLGTDGHSTDTPSTSLSSSSPAPSRPASRSSSLSEMPMASQSAVRPYIKHTLPDPTPKSTPFTPVAAPQCSRAKKAPLYSASAQDALVLPAPPSSDTNAANHVDVVVDPLISRLLRPHQRDGVIFLYECLMGYRNQSNHGALLCDEMSLGKTLTTISLIWTLLRQNPISTSKQPVVKKVLIACPVTLIDNWRREFNKWLDRNRIGVLALNNKSGSSTAKDKQDIINFGKTRVYQVLIMSYEKMLSCQEELGTVTFDMVVCDEGHRLKNSANKVIKVFNDKVKCDRKILLTGTPIQNDLVEFFNIIDFVNPGVLGSFKSFQKEYINPIQRSRDVNCKNKDTIKRGEAISNQLIHLTQSFILRRTASSISHFLPDKTDVIIFCPPTSIQIQLFEYIIRSKKFSSLLDGATSNPNNSLALITLFKKICNSPSLVSKDKLFHSLISNPVDDANKENNSSPSSEMDIAKLTTNYASSKINLLIPLLIEFKRLQVKTVLVSNYTQTLDLLQLIIQKLNMTFSRLDGSTPNKNRDSLVTSFNKSPEISVFLLSAKSGGVGLNLVGASRLILFDNDWNPSVDLQAMARIHRDGQKHPVFIYRILTTGCIDEKILQRQLMKNNLSDKFLDGKVDSKSNSFDLTDLKDLFTINKETLSNTHDLLECPCEGNGANLQDIILDDSDDDEDSDEEGNDEPPGWISALDYKQEDERPKHKKLSIRNALADYRHFNPTKSCSGKASLTEDDVLNEIIKAGAKNAMPISYIFTKLSSRNIADAES